jgi:hypothetical protein
MTATSSVNPELNIYIKALPLSFGYAGKICHAYNTLTWTVFSLEVHLQYWCNMDLTVPI